MDTKRFKNPEYKKQVVALRQHRRPVARLPETRIQKILFAVGLDSIWKRILAAGVFLFLVYAIYFASWLRITEILVNGADAQASSGIQAQSKRFLKEFADGLPEKNLLFFRPQRLKDFLQQRDLDISEVTEIKRHLLHTIEITVVQRVPAFNLQSGNNFYVLESDAVIGPQVQVVNPNMLTIIDSAPEQLQTGKILFNAQHNGFLSYISQNFTPYTGQPIDHFEMPGVASDDLIVFNKAGARILFDNTADPKVSLSRFVTIWSSLNPDQQAKLDYVDLRFDPKAFVCYKDTPCAQNLQTEAAPTVNN